MIRGPSSNRLADCGCHEQGIESDLSQLSKYVQAAREDFQSLPHRASR